MKKRPAPDNESRRLLSQFDNYWTETDEIMSRYGMSLEEAEGRSYTHCKMTGMPCNNCRGYAESKTCIEATPRVRGLSSITYQILFLMAAPLNDQVKSFNQYHGESGGQLPWGGSRTADRPLKAVMKNESTGETRYDRHDFILTKYDKFPFDQSPNTPREAIDLLVSQNERRANEMEKRGEFDPTVWTKYRGECAKGKHGEILKRYAFDPTAWNVYNANKDKSPEYIGRLVRITYLGHLVETSSDKVLAVKAMDRLASL